LELYKKSIEINKNYYYSHFKKEKQKLHLGPLLLFSHSSAQQTHGPVARSLAPSRAAQQSPAQHVRASSLANRATPPVIPLLPLSLSPRDPAMTARWSAGDHDTGDPTNPTNTVYTIP
jgi:hypothetical protein